MKMKNGQKEIYGVSIKYESNFVLPNYEILFWFEEMVDSSASSPTIITRARPGV